MLTARFVFPAALAAAGFLVGSCYQSTVDLSGPLSDTPEIRDDGGGRDDADARPEGSRDDAAGPDDAVPPPDIPPDAPLPCWPFVNGPYTLEPPATLGAEEQPVIIPSLARDGFIAFTRASGPSGAHGLRFHRLGLHGTEVAASMWTLAGVELGPHHPLLALPGDNYAAAFTVPEGATTGVWLKIVPSSGTGGEVPRQVPETDESCIEPAIALDDTGGVVMWNKVNDDEGWPYPDELWMQRFDTSTGETIGPRRFLGEGAFSEARILWVGGCLVLAFADDATSALRVLTLDTELEVLDDTMWASERGRHVVGAPALARTDWGAGVLFEVHDSSTASLMLARFRCYGGIAEVYEVPMDRVLSPDEPGEVALAWAAELNEWGVAWTFVNEGVRFTRIARIGADDYALPYGSSVTDSSTEWKAHPAIAYAAGYYGIVWTEGTAPFVSTRVATYGCTP